MTQNLLQPQAFDDPVPLGRIDAAPARGTVRPGQSPRTRVTAVAAGRVATVTLVCFRVAGTAYCMPVELTRSVRLAVGLVPLPEPGRDVVGVIPGDPPLTVVAPFGLGGGHVLVIAARGTTFGLLVDEVTRLLTVPAADVGAAPGGQHRALISGTVNAGGELLMITDPMTMVEQL